MDIEQLNSKEKVIFQRIGQGIKAARIAQELKISVNTVHVYRFRILRALGLKSTTELVKAYIYEQALGCFCSACIQDLSRITNIKD